MLVDMDFGGSFQAGTNSSVWIDLQGIWKDLFIFIFLGCRGDRLIQEWLEFCSLFELLEEEFCYLVSVRVITSRMNLEEMKYNIFGSLGRVFFQTLNLRWASTREEEEPDSFLRDPTKEADLLLS